MDLLRLEQQRRALEQTLQKLRSSLRYYQTVSAELEGLREEIETSSIPDDLDFVALSKTYNGDLVNEKEVRDLAGLDSDSPRTIPQVLGVISRRQEYVQRNIETLQRQFWDAEAKLEELDFVALRGDDNTGGLPLTEIHEELDEEGNVISSRLLQPEEQTIKLVETLRKAGVPEQDLKELVADGEREEEDESDGQSATSGTHSVPPPAIVDRRSKTTIDFPTLNSDTNDDENAERPVVRKKSVSFTADTKPPPEPVRQESEDGRKSVSFNDKIAVMPAAPPPDTRSVSFSPKIEEIPAEPTTLSPEVQAKSDPAIQKDLRSMFKLGDKVHQFNDDDDLAATHVVIPEGEAEEEARARREMLDYHLHEVGHIVAEMDLVEYEDAEEEEDEDDEATSASDFASSDRFDTDTPYTGMSEESEDESEDEHGRTKKRVISDDYHKQMQELKHRLIGNLGPAPSDTEVNDVDPEFTSADVRRLVVREKRNSTSSMSSDGDKQAAGKKRVSFAEALDVADEAAPPLKAAKHTDGENTAPLADAVSERSTTTIATTNPPSAPSPTETSRFKKSRAAPVADKSNDASSMDVDEYGAPSGPAGKIIADTLLERTTPKQQIAAPSVDEPDPIMQRRELAAEYYRRRNELVRQQGGFKANADEEEEAGEWMEERDGKLKKVSRFRAARIKPQ